MFDVRRTIRSRDGTFTTVDVGGNISARMARDDAKEAQWACIRALDAVGVYRLSLVEVDKAVSWQIEVVSATAMVTTAALMLSSMAYVWHREATFELASVKVTLWIDHSTSIN